MNGWVHASKAQKGSFQSHDPHIERMEKAFKVWIEDQTEKKEEAFEWTGVQEKPLCIYSDFE